MTTEKQKPEQNEIASVATDFDIFQGFMEQLANPDEVLRLECGGDIRIYDNIGRDGRVSSNLGTRARAVIGKEWTVTPFSQETIDIKVAEYVTGVFLGFPFDRARRSILRGGTLKGFAISEIMWDYSEGDTFIANMKYRHQRRFTFDTYENILLKTIENPMGMNVSIRDGLPLKKFQHVSFGDEVETPYGIGLGRELYWPWWFKKNGIKFWVMFCEKFAGPTVVGEYEPGSDPADQNKLLAAGQAFHSNSAVIHPKGMSLRLVEAARSGNISTYRELCEFMNDEMTISILGQTATTTGTPGKLGNEQAQENVKNDLVKADADSLCEAFNARDTGVIRWLVDYQFPGLGRYPQMWIDCEEEEDKKTLAERDDKLSTSMEKSGLRLTKSYYVRQHGLKDDDVESSIPLPPNGKIPLTPQPISFAEGVNADTKNPYGICVACNGLTLKVLDKHPCPYCNTTLNFAEGNAPAQDSADLIAESTNYKKAMAETEKWNQQVRALIAEVLASGGGLPELSAKLAALFPAMDAATFGDLMAQAMTLSDAAGRADVMDETP